MIGSFAGTGVLIERLGGRDSGDGPVGADEDHVERDERVLHPEGHVLRRVIREDHAFVGPERTVEHEALFLLLGSGGDLDVELVRARRRADGQRHLSQPLWSSLVGGNGRRIRLRRRRVLRRRLPAASRERDESEG